MHLGPMTAIVIHMKQMLAVLLAIILSGNLVAQSEPPTSARAQVMNIPVGTKLNVKMKGGDKIRGRLLSVDQNGFTISTGRAKRNASRVINFRDAESVVPEQRSHTPVVAWIAAGAIAAGVVIVVVAFVIERHNEGG